MFTEDLTQFFTDFAVSATVGAETAQVIFDSPDSAILDGVAITAEYRITYPIGTFNGLKYKDAVTVDGTAYTVNTVQAIGDGKLVTAALSKS